MWAALIKRYWHVAIFKETPANTPYSPFLLVAITVCFYMVIVFQWMITDVDEAFTQMDSLIAAGALVASYGLYTLALLLPSHLRGRLVQTLTSLLAGHTIVHVFALPLLLITPWLAEAKLVQPVALMVGVFYLILTLVLTVWQFMVTVHIYKHALAIHYFPAVLASFGLLASNILIVSFWR